jgi:16S rRNA processing protein RimM
MTGLVIIARIVKPQGIKGEVKLESYSEDPMRFNRFKSVYVNGIPYEVEQSRVSDGVYLKLKGVNDRNAAELLRGAEISIERSMLSKPVKGRYYIADLLGLEVFSEGEKLGILEDILQNGGVDVYVVRLTGGKTLMFPALKDLLKDVNVDKKTIELESKRLSEVGVYED